MEKLAGQENRFPVIIVPRHRRLGEGFSRAEQLKAQAHPGRQTDPKKGYQSAVSFISDLIALRKVIILCDFCKAKFNPRKQFGYRQVYVPDYTGRTSGYTVNGQCDSCKQNTVLCGGGTAFEPEELYARTHIDPCEARRIARARAGQLGTWRFIQKELNRALKEKKEKKS